MKNLFFIGFLISLLAIFGTGCNDSGGGDSSTSTSTSTDPYDLNKNYQIYVDYAEANNRDVSKCEQNISCDYCGFIGNDEIKAASCEYPPNFCFNSESCQ